MKLLSQEEILELSNGQVTSPILFVSGNPDPNGLFSEIIFGKTLSEQSRNFGHIELNCRVFSPHVFKMIIDAFRNTYKEMIKFTPYIIKDNEIKFLEEEDLEKVDKQYVYYGIHGLITNLYKLKDENTESKFKKQLWTIIDKYGLDKCVISVYPVVPVKIRPYRSEFEYDELNDLYINLIRYSNAIATADPLNRYKYGILITQIQKTILEIYNYLKTKTGKSKTALIRGALLGKSVDFSARSVASVNPEIPPDYLGIPFRIVVSLYEPWIIKEMTQRMKITVDKAILTLQKISKGFKVDDKLYKQIREIAEEVVKDRYVVAKRDPNLHRGSIRSFKIKIVDDLTIQVHPTITGSFNLDFDGDTMAVFAPLTQEAQEDARKMHSLYHSGNPRKLMVEFTQELKAGFYIMLSLDIPESVPRNWWWFKQTKKDGVIITEGRYRIYELLPKGFKETIDIKDFAKDPKLTIDSIVYLMIKQEVPHKDIADFVYKSVRLALDVITKATTSLDLEHFKLSEISEHYKKEIAKAKTDMEKQELLDKMKSDILTRLEETDIGVLLKSGILKEEQLFQLLGAKGLVLNPEGKTELISSNFVNGLKPTEYFISSFGARNGIIYRVNKTATTGYLYRKLVYGLASVQLDEGLDFCGTTKTMLLKNVDMKTLNTLVNRYVIVDNKVTRISLRDLKSFEGKDLELYTPIYCTSKHICKRCFGEDYKLIGTKNIGFVAAASIGERATQEMLKAFHVGGVVKPDIVDFFKNVSENTNIPIETFQKIFTQNKLNFYTSREITLIFEKELYNLKYFLGDMDELPLSLFMAKLKVKGKKNDIDIVYDGGINLIQPYSIEQDKERYYLTYRPGSLVFRISQEVMDMDRLANKMLATIEGRVVVKDERHLFNKLYNMIQKIGNINSVWIEILVSQLLRDSENPKIPARLGKPYKPTIVSIKEIPYLESWLRSLEFENFSKAVTYGLIDEENEATSVLEELI